jgi:hypothetical protein
MEDVAYWCPKHKTAYFVASSRFFNFAVSTTHGHMHIKYLSHIYRSHVLHGQMIMLMSSYQSQPLQKQTAVITDRQSTEPAADTRRS